MISNLPQHNYDKYFYSGIGVNRWCIGTWKIEKKNTEANAVSESHCYTQVNIFHSFMNSTRSHYYQFMALKSLFIQWILAKEYFQDFFNEKSFAEGRNQVIKVSKAANF